MKKVLVDTSVWIAFLRGRDKRVIGEVSRLLTTGLTVTSGIVLTELLQGALDEKEMAKIVSLFEPVDRIDLASGDWETAGRLSYELRKKGMNGALVDILLATLAIENDCLLYSEDKHFTLIARYSELELYSTES